MNIESAVHEVMEQFDIDLPSEIDRFLSITLFHEIFDAIPDEDVHQGEAIDLENVDWDFR